MPPPFWDWCVPLLIAAIAVCAFMRHRFRHIVVWRVRAMPEGDIIWTFPSSNRSARHEDGARETGIACDGVANEIDVLRERCAHASAQCAAPPASWTVASTAPPLAR